MRDVLIPYQVFISYAHIDDEVAAIIRTDLQQKSIPIWIDRTGLPSGTPNWSTAIRNALRSSCALLLLASPQSGQSNVVHGEIDEAKRLGIPIFPLWVQGNEWSECIPLDMARTQYIDCRNEHYASGISQIATILQETLTKSRPKHCLYTGEYLCSQGKLLLPPDYSLIYLNKEAPLSYFHNSFSRSINAALGQSISGEVFIALCPNAFPSLRYMLDDLYLEYLSNRYNPYTYGSKWILGFDRKYGFSRGVTRLLVPWEWLTKPAEQPLASYYHTWEDSPIDFYYRVYDPDFSLRFPIGPFSAPDLQIINRPLESVIGIATNSRKVAALLSYGDLDSKRFSYFLNLLYSPIDPNYRIPELKDISIKEVDATTVNSARYRYQFVFTSYFSEGEKRVFIVDE
jgi:TIR domain